MCAFVVDADGKALEVDAEKPPRRGGFCDIYPLRLGDRWAHVFRIYRPTALDISPERPQREQSIYSFLEGQPDGSQYLVPDVRFSRLKEKWRIPNTTLVYPAGSPFTTLKRMRTVAEFLADCRSRGWPTLEIVLAIGVELLDCLAFLHRHSIFHFDVSPDNVLVDSNTADFRDAREWLWHRERRAVKFADFNVSRDLGWMREQAEGSRTKRATMDFPPSHWAQWGPMRDHIDAWAQKLSPGSSVDDGLWSEMCSVLSFNDLYLAIRLVGYFLTGRIDAFGHDRVDHYKVEAIWPEAAGDLKSAFADCIQKVYVWAGSRERADELVSTRESMLDAVVAVSESLANAADRMTWFAAMHGYDGCALRAPPTDELTAAWHDRFSELLPPDRERFASLLEELFPSSHRRSGEQDFLLLKGDVMESLGRHGDAEQLAARLPPPTLVRHRPRREWVQRYVDSRRDTVGKALAALCRTVFEVWAQQIEDDAFAKASPVPKLNTNVKAVLGDLRRELSEMGEEGWLNPVAVGALSSKLGGALGELVSQRTAALAKVREGAENVGVDRDREILREEKQREACMPEEWLGKVEKLAGPWPGVARVAVGQLMSGPLADSARRTGRTLPSLPEEATEIADMERSFESLEVLVDRRSSPEERASALDALLASGMRHELMPEAVAVVRGTVRAAARKRVLSFVAPVALVLGACWLAPACAQVSGTSAIAATQIDLGLLSLGTLVVLALLRRSAALTDRPIAARLVYGAILGSPAAMLWAMQVLPPDHWLPGRLVAAALGIVFLSLAPALAQVALGLLTLAAGTTGSHPGRRIRLRSRRALRSSANATAAAALWLELWACYSFPDAAWLCPLAGGLHLAAAVSLLYPWLRLRAMKPCRDAVSGSDGEDRLRGPQENR